MVTSSSEDADVDVQNATRQQDSSVKTDKQDSEMSLAAENDDRTTTQLTEGQRGNSIDETRVIEDFRRQHVDKIRLQDLEYGEVEVGSGEEENLDKDEKDEDMEAEVIHKRGSIDMEAWHDEHVKEV